MNDVKSTVPYLINISTRSSVLAMQTSSASFGISAISTEVSDTSNLRTASAVTAPAFSEAVNVSVRVVVLGYTTITFQPSVFAAGLAAFLHEESARVLVISVTSSTSARRSLDAVQVQSVVATKDKLRASNVLAALSSPDASANLTMQLQALGMLSAKVSNIGASLQVQEQSTISSQNLGDSGPGQFSIALIAGLGALAGIILLLLTVILMKQFKTKKIVNVDSSQHLESRALTGLERLEVANAEIVVVTRGNARSEGRHVTLTGEVEPGNNTITQSDFQYFLPMHMDSSVSHSNDRLSTTQPSEPNDTDFSPTWSVDNHQNTLHHRTGFVMPVSASNSASVEADIVYKGCAWGTRGQYVVLQSKWCFQVTVALGREKSHRHAGQADFFDHWMKEDNSIGLKTSASDCVFKHL
jgi:hypothetical protein